MTEKTMKRRRIAVVTGSRADYGLLYWIIKGIKENKRLELKLLVTGSHLMKRFGETARTIREDGFPVAAKVDISVASDNEVSVAGSIARGVSGFAKVYSKLRPDIIVVLGDRFEILASVTAALPFRIPVAHIHGGESTEGVMDEAIRHAITKMSHIHFASTREYADRIAQMGEDPKNVFSFGAPGLDNIKRLKPIGRERILSELGLPRDKKIGVVTYHPVTLEKDTAGAQISDLLKAISSFPDIFWVFTFPNMDTGASTIIRKIRSFVRSNPGRAKVFISLGQLRYLSLLKAASVMAGNSSSGLIEAPSFGLPVVNIGDRQRGRIRGSNVIDVAVCGKKGIVSAIKKALRPAFRGLARRSPNPYGHGDASAKIVAKLGSVKLGEQLLKKRFSVIRK